jgi:hypothetical protein
MAWVGAVSREHRGCELGVSQGAMDEPGMHASFAQRRSVGLPQGVDGRAPWGNAGALCGCAEGALATGATQRGGCGRTVSLVAPRGGKEPGGVTVGLPIGAEQREGLGGQGDVPVLGALPAMALDLEALAVHSGARKGKGFLESEAQARDGGAGDRIVPRCGGRQEPSDLLHPAEGGETGCSVRTQEREGVPVAREDVRKEEADATGAEAHGRWGEAVDVFAVQEVMRKFLCREAVGGCVVELRQQTSCPDRGLLGTLSLATAVESRNHVVTQWGHEISSFVHGRMVRVRRKTS